MRDVQNWLVVLAFIPALAFVLLYLPRPWWGNPAGRAAMTLSASLTGVLLLILVRRFGVDLPEWVWTAGYAVVGAALWVQLGGYITVRWGGGGTVDGVPGPEEEHHDRARQPQG